MMTSVGLRTVWRRALAAAALGAAIALVAARAYGREEEEQEYMSAADEEDEDEEEGDSEEAASPYVPFSNEPAAISETPDWLREAATAQPPAYDRSETKQRERSNSNEERHHARLVSADGSAGCMRMGVTLNVLSLHGIDTAAQRFNIELVLLCRTLNAASLRTEGGAAVNRSNWEPRIRLLNLIATDSWQMRARTASAGELEFKYHVQGTLAEPFELTLFPFDTQTLTIQLSSAIPAAALAFEQPPPTPTPRGVGSETPAAVTSAAGTAARTTGGEVESKRRSSVWSKRVWAVIQLSNFSESNVFELSHAINAKAGVTCPTASTSGTCRPLLKMSMAFRRSPRYYLFSVILPTQTLSLLSLGTFLIAPADLADRLSVSLTLVLTVASYSSAASADLPKLGHLTFLDRHLLSSILFTVLVAGASLLEATEWGVSHLGGATGAWLFALHLLSWFLLAASCFAADAAGRERLRRHDDGAFVAHDVATGHEAGCAMEPAGRPSVMSMRGLLVLCLMEVPCRIFRAAIGLVIGAVASASASASLANAVSSSTCGGSSAPNGGASRSSESPRVQRALFA